MEKRVKCNFLYNAIYQILVITVPLVMTPYLSRVLGPTLIGRYSYAYSIAYYFGLFVLLGVNNYGCRSIAQARKHENSLLQEFWSIYAIQFLLMFVMSVAYCVYFLFLAKDKVITKILLLYIISVGLDINWFFAGLEKFKILITRNAIVKLITTILIFTFVKKNTDLKAYSVIMCFGFVISQLTLWIYFFRENVLMIPHWITIKKHIKPDIILFIPVLAISLFTIMDKVMLGYFSGEIEVGYYESVEKIKNLPMAIVTALGTVMLPYISNQFSALEEKYISTISKSMVFALITVTEMVFGLISVADLFVPLFYGEGYEKCVTLYGLLLPSCIFIAFANVIRTQYLIPQNMNGIYVWSVILGAVVNIFMNLFLIPRYRSYGAALATLCAEVVVCMYQAYRVKEILPISKYLKWLIFFVIIGFGLCILNRKIVHDADTIFNELITKIVFGVIYYIFILGILSIFARASHKNEQCGKKIKKGKYSNEK